MTTKDKLQQALQGVDGEKETVCIIYCDNEEQSSSIGLIGDVRHTSGAIAHYLLKVCKMECEENELACANAIIQAVAAVDYQTGGDFVRLIQAVEEKNVKNSQNEIPN